LFPPNERERGERDGEGVREGKKKSSEVKLTEKGVFVKC
jgi:hypothetical protein